MRVVVALSDAEFHRIFLERLQGTYQVLGLNNRLAHQDAKRFAQKAMLDHWIVGVGGDDVTEVEVGWFEATAHFPIVGCGFVFEREVAEVRALVKVVQKEVDNRLFGLYGVVRRRTDCELGFIGNDSVLNVLELSKEHVSKRLIDLVQHSRSIRSTLA